MKNLLNDKKIIEGQIKYKNSIEKSIEKL